jgi:hypothetical protein
VKSLVDVPRVLAMMSEMLDWTVNVGNAFLGQREQVMETVQKLRAKAKEAGNLASTNEQDVSTEAAEGADSIVIEPAEPTVVYVPVYDPTSVYGVWWYPSYPPACWYPPDYAARSGIWFGTGFTLGAAWGYAWGSCDWRHGDVDVDVHRNAELNPRVDRGRYARQLDRAGVDGGRGAWRHDPAHRHGTPYRDAATTRQYVGAASVEAASQRAPYRGRTTAGAAGVGREGDLRSATSPPAPASSGVGPASGGAAFDDVAHGGSSTRAASARGRTSRSASAGARGRRG